MRSQLDADHSDGLGAETATRAELSLAFDIGIWLTHARQVQHEFQPHSLRSCETHPNYLSLIHTSFGSPEKKMLFLRVDAKSDLS